MHIGISGCLTHVAYDAASPTGLVWTQTIGTRAKAGAVAGRPHKDGYWTVGILGVTYLCHRIVWALHHGDPGVKQVDHVDRVRTHNKIGNLRLATNSLNQCNVVRAGAYWLEGKQHWEASVTLNGVRKYKRNKDKAVVDAWLEATKKEVHGEYKAASQ